MSPIPADEMLTIGEDFALPKFTCEPSSPMQPAPSNITAERREGCLQGVENVPLGPFLHCRNKAALIEKADHALCGLMDNLTKVASAATPIGN